MIGSLSGVVVEVAPDALLLDVSGVGYELTIPASLAAELQVEESARVAVHTHVREDAFQLYGFKNTGTRDLFRVLLKIKGVGPRVALAILSVFTHQELVARVRAGSPSFLSTVPGIGKKTAEKIFLDLKDLIKDVAVGDSQTSLAPQSTVAEETVAALEGLGYKQAMAAKAVATLQPADGERVETFLVKALKVING